MIDIARPLAVGAVLEEAGTRDHYRVTEVICDGMVAIEFVDADEHK